MLAGLHLHRSLPTPLKSPSGSIAILMGRVLLLEAWIGLILHRQRRGGKTESPREAAAAAAAPTTIGILALEVAGTLSRVAHLWRSLADDQVCRLRDDVVRLEGVRKLVSDDRSLLLSLALSEMLEALGAAATAAAVLGRRCSDPALRRLEHVLPEIVAAAATGGARGAASERDLGGLRRWAFAGRKMERKVKKMERLATATVQLYQEMEVLAEMEQSLRRTQQMNTGAPGFASFFHFQGASMTDLRQKVVWQKQEVKALRDRSLWNRSYDYVVRLLARSLFTILIRIYLVFGFRPPPSAAVDARPSSAPFTRSRSVAAYSSSFRQAYDGCTAADVRIFCSGPLEGSGRATTKSGPLVSTKLAGPISKGTTTSISAAAGGGGGQRSSRWSVPGGPFRGCMMGGSDPPVLQSCVASGDGGRRPNMSAARSRPTGILSADEALAASLRNPKSGALCAPPSTLGASALAPHYANIIIVIEKLAEAPGLIGREARDDLYQMLPTGIRAALRARLKPYAKDLASGVYDPVLGEEWSGAMARILEWLAPLAHNMVRWQSERNYGQQLRVSASSVLLLQTLHFANQAKTEAAIVELLVGLNYLWRFSKDIHDSAAMGYVSNRES